MRLLADPVYNPLNNRVIDSYTKLAPGVNMSTFLGSIGNRSSWEYIVDEIDKRYQARHLYLHAELMRGFNVHPHFKNHRLVPVESVGQDKNLDNGPKTGDIYSKLYWGLGVTYEVYNSGGEVDNAMTYDLAVYWKDHMIYDRLYLYWDKYNPEGTLHSQIYFEVPNVTTWYQVNSTPDYDVATYVAGSKYTSNEISEMIDD